MIITDERFNELKSTYTDYLPKLATVHQEFGGPSVYFHQKALLACNQSFLSERHIEMIYATLSSWGMHRMGRTNTKMVGFDEFKESILALSNELHNLRFHRLEEYDKEPTAILDNIQSICFKLRASASKSKIVGNSKTLAHILPHLVPPIDREYTIRFFARAGGNFRNDEEQRIFSHILRKCYEFIKVLQNDSRVVIDGKFNTSFPKIFDNLLMLHIKSLQ